MLGELAIDIQIYWHQFFLTNVTKVPLFYGTYAQLEQAVYENYADK